MAVDRKTLAQYRAYVKQMGPVDTGKFAIFDTIPEILGYLVACGAAVDSRTPQPDIASRCKNPGA